MKNKYRVQATVSIEVALSISADSLEDALKAAREMEKNDPVRAGFVLVPRRAEYLWNNETSLTGVMDA